MGERQKNFLLQLPINLSCVHVSFEIFSSLPSLSPEWELVSPIIIGSVNPQFQPPKKQLTYACKCTEASCWTIDYITGALI
jgi:hypothetical protein